MWNSKILIYSQGLLFNFFANGFTHHVLLTFLNVVKLSVENDFVLSLPNVVYINVEKDNIDLTF